MADFTDKLAAQFGSVLNDDVKQAIRKFLDTDLEIKLSIEEELNKALPDVIPQFIENAKNIAELTSRLDDPEVLRLIQEEADKHSERIALKKNIPEDFISEVAKLKKVFKEEVIEDADVDMERKTLDDILKSSSAVQPAAPELSVQQPSSALNSKQIEIKTEIPPPVKTPDLNPVNAKTSQDLILSKDEKDIEDIITGVKLPENMTKALEGFETAVKEFSDLSTYRGITQRSLEAAEGLKTAKTENTNNEELRVKSEGRSKAAPEVTLNLEEALDRENIGGQIAESLLGDGPLPVLASTTGKEVSTDTPAAPISVEVQDSQSPFEQAQLVSVGPGKPSPSSKTDKTASGREAAALLRVQEAAERISARESGTPANRLSEVTESLKQEIRKASSPDFIRSLASIESSQAIIFAKLKDTGLGETEQKNLQVEALRLSLEKDEVSKRIEQDVNEKLKKNDPKVAEVRKLLSQVNVLQQQVNDPGGMLRRSPGFFDRGSRVSSSFQGHSSRTSPIFKGHMNQIEEAPVISMGPTGRQTSHMRTGTSLGRTGRSSYSEMVSDFRRSRGVDSEEDMKEGAREYANQERIDLERMVVERAETRTRNFSKLSREIEKGDMSTQEKKDAQDALRKNVLKDKAAADEILRQEAYSYKTGTGALGGSFNLMSSVDRGREAVRNRVKSTLSVLQDSTNSSQEVLSAKRLEELFTFIEKVKG